MKRSHTETQRVIKTCMEQTNVPVAAGVKTTLISDSVYTT